MADAGVVEAPEPTFDADPRVVRALVEAERLSWGHQHNPAFATEISLIDPLPHQRLAVYDHLLGQQRLRFFLADDAGAGKTIMTGLYLREMFARRLLRRVLIVPPAGLVGNWESELRRLFGLRFRVVRGAEAKRRNPFVGDDSDLLIVSVDTLAGDLFQKLQEPEVIPYDLVVFDEAHKLGANRDDDLGIDATERYRLAEALCGAPVSPKRKDRPGKWQLDWACTHVLLLTATPHMGKDFPYYCLWRLLEPQVLPTFESFLAHSTEWRVTRFLRRTKEEMVRFDGKPLYPRRECHTVTYPLNQGTLSEQTLYDETTRYLEKYYNLSRLLNRGAVRFAMSVFQRRLASSTWAMYRSFENRLGKLKGLIDRVRNGQLTIEEVNRLALSAATDPFEARTGDEEDPQDGKEQNEVDADHLMGVVVAASLGELEAEREEVSRLKQLAWSVYQRRDESKFEKLREWLSAPRFADEKVLLFTEHRDTANFLVERLEQLGMGGQIGMIHGGMDYKERDEQAASFNRPLAEGGTRWLVATDAAAEGINLQRQCWLMVNYDLPWNPARLEQRMGRIHRYGQQHDPVVILNLVAADTREGRVMAKLLEKLEAIRHQLSSDKVFDVIGQVFSGLSLNELMMTLTAPGGEQRAAQLVEGHLTVEQVEALKAREARLFGDGGDVKRHMARLAEQQEREGLRRLMPGHVAGFLTDAAPLLGMRFVGDPDGVFRFEDAQPGATVSLQAAAAGYAEELQGRFTVHRLRAGRAIFVHPGEPVFDHVRAALQLRFPGDARRGAFFVDPTAAQPYLLHIAQLSVVRRAEPSIRSLSRSELLATRLVAVRQQPDGHCSPTSLEHFLLLRPGRGPVWSHAATPNLPTGLIPVADAVFRQQLAEDVEAQRGLRQDALAERRSAVSHGFAGLEAELLARFTRLKERKEEGDEKAREVFGQTVERMKRLDARKREALAAIEREVELVSAGPVEFLAHAWVLPSSDPRDREAYDTAIEQRAMDAVIAYEQALGSRVRDVHTPELARTAGLTDWPGFDLEAIRPPTTAGAAGERLCIEVKGRAKSGEVELSYNEWAQAETLRAQYWLYTVFDCAAEYPRLVRVRDPAGRLSGHQVKVRIDPAEILAAAEPEFENG